MIECNLNGVDLPDRVQRIVDGIGSSPPCCGHCRKPGASLRCSRCRCVKYCSVLCQKDHFALHKKNCKKIQKKRILVEKNWAGEKEGGHVPDSMLDMITEVSLTNLTTTTTFEFADLLVQVGYRESDTVANGSLYYREALKYYLMPIKLLSEDEYRDDYYWVEDRVLLLMVILGADESHTQALVLSKFSKRYFNYSPSRYLREIVGPEIEGNNEFKTVGYARNDLPFQAMLLLSQMKLLVTYRKRLEGLEVYKEIMQDAVASLGYSTSVEDSLGYSTSVEDIYKHVAPFLMGEAHEGRVEMEVMPDEIRTIISALLHHKHDGFLRHLKRSIPLQIQHAPALFSPAHYNPHFFPGTPDVSAPSELWMIFQDCFFEIPGMNDILDEFIPDELIDNRA